MKQKRQLNYKTPEIPYIESDKSSPRKNRDLIQYLETNSQIYA